MEEQIVAALQPGEKWLDRSSNVHIISLPVVQLADGSVLAATGSGLLN